MNVAAYSAISKCETVNYVGPINPPPIKYQKLWSKFRRVIGTQGTFFFFSEQRLDTIASEVRARCHPDARLDFFHGFTPWVAVRPEHPYIAWSDCTFRDYVEIYHRREQFLRDDLDRIEQMEAEWLRNANRVLFTSEWAVERAVRHYSLNVDRVASVGIFGEVEPPCRDAYAGGKEFVFVSTNFEAKGGPIVLAAFQELRRSYPDASLVIVGDRPNLDLTSTSGVRCTGFLRKEVPWEYRQFREIVGAARAIVSATTSDICPLLFVEAAYFGCPVISTRRFAIPEIVNHGRTGLLLDRARDASGLARAMCRMLELSDEYSRMREAARVNALAMHSRERFEERLCSCLGILARTGSNEVAKSG